jgi:hypothetical protein
MVTISGKVYVYMIRISVKVCVLPKVRRYVRKL